MSPPGRRDIRLAPGVLTTRPMGELFLCYTAHPGMAVAWFEQNFMPIDWIAGPQEDVWIPTSNLPFSIVRQTEVKLALMPDSDGRPPPAGPVRPSLKLDPPPSA